jgi:hypothetical protein
VKDNFIKAVLLVVGKWFNDYPWLTLISTCAVLFVLAFFTLSVCKNLYLNQQKESRGVVSNGSENVNVDVNNGTIKQTNQPQK